MVSIVDYGMGNLRSVQKALNRVGCDADITSNIQKIAEAEKLILPGVGHFRRGMQNLEELGLIELLNKKVLEEKTPILGICLGMQLFTMHSEEGDSHGLGWIDAQTIRFQFDQEKSNVRIPHIGWNNVQVTKENLLFKGLSDSASFYFVHSYYVKCSKPENVLATSDYGLTFACSINKDNIWGTQFHPEKSHDDGLVILENFLNIV